MTSDLNALGLIPANTRAQAIEDGQLVDVTAVAHAVGVRCPVALTRGAHARCVAARGGVQRQYEADRLHDVLRMLRAAILRGVPADQEGTTLLLELQVRYDDRPGPAQPVELKAVIGPDDGGDGCVTLMLPNEI